MKWIADYPGTQRTDSQRLEAHMILGRKIWKQAESEREGRQRGIGVKKFDHSDGICEN